MTCRHHQIHTKERENHQFDELAAADGLLLAVVPLDGLKQDEEKTYVKDVFNAHNNRRGDKHATESRFLTGVHRQEETADGESAKQSGGEDRQLVLCAFGQERIEQEN